MLRLLAVLVVELARVDGTNYCHFHKNYKHNNDECPISKKEIKSFVQSTNLKEITDCDMVVVRMFASEERESQKGTCYSSPI